MPLVLFEPASIHAVGETVPKVGADVVGTKVVGANEGAAVIERVGDDVDTPVGAAVGNGVGDADGSNGAK